MSFRALNLSPQMLQAVHDAGYTEPTPVQIAAIPLMSDALPFGKLWYGEPNAINNAVNCAGGKRFEKASKSLDKRKD